MSIASVQLLRTRTGKFSTDYTETYEIEYQVHTNNDNDGPNAVLQANDGTNAIPSLWAYYQVGNDLNTFAFVTEKEANEVDRIATGGSIWKVKVSYKTNQVKKYQNPLDQPTRYSIEWAQHERVVEKDNDGNPLVNTVGDVFIDPPYKQDDSRPVLRAYRNESDVLSRLQFMTDYKDAINNDNFHGAAPGTVKLRNITTGDIQTQNGVDFYKVTYEFEYDPDGWQPEILNRGHRAKDGSGNIYDLPKKEIRNLNQDSTVQGPSDDPYYIPFSTFKERGFASLQL